jgi:hypothetical protein
MLAFAAQQNFVRYFIDYDKQYSGFVPNTNEIAASVTAAQPQGVTLDNTYIIYYSTWVDPRNVGIKLGDIMWSFTHTINKNQSLPTPKNNQPLFFLLNKNDTAHIVQLRSRWPEGQMNIVHSTINARKDFMTFLVLPAAAPSP